MTRLAGIQLWVGNVASDLSANCRLDGPKSQRGLFVGSWSRNWSPEINQQRGDDIGQRGLGVGLANRGLVSLKLTRGLKSEISFAFPN